MSSARRRINSTGRKKIPQDKIDLRILTTVHGEPLKAKLTIDLDALGLPPTAALSVEAYHRSSAMRFVALQPHRRVPFELAWQTCSNPSATTSFMLLNVAISNRKIRF